MFPRKPQYAIVLNISNNVIGRKQANLVQILQFQHLFRMFSAQMTSCFEDYGSFCEYRSTDYVIQ